MPEGNKKIENEVMSFPGFEALVRRCQHLMGEGTGGETIILVSLPKE